MAKKKKKSAKKQTSSEQPRQSSAFWKFSTAILLILLSFFFLLGSFGTGGLLPEKLFNAAYSFLGWAAYLSPIALLYFGFHKLRGENRKIPLKKLISMLSFIAASAAFFYTVSAKKDIGGSWSGGHGGNFGEFIGGIILQALDKIPAGIMFFILTAVAFSVSFNISPKILLKPFVGRKEKQDDTDLVSLKTQSEQQFKLNEGVPTEHNPEAKLPKLATLKNTARSLSETENHEALTVANDATWKFPPIDLLDQKQDKADAGDVQANAEIIRETLNNFKISVDMEGANVGPRVTQYTLKPPTGVKLTKITALDNNLALDLAAHSIRIEAPIPGKRLVGIEVPNIKQATVRISSVLDSPQWRDQKTPLSFVVGKDISGIPIVGDLAAMPHLLVAGQTGSGKSVMINTILTSLLYRNSPSDLKLILVDPKQVELTPYNDLPHLLAPVVHEPEKCISALKWAVAEMERRLRTMAEAGKRNIGEYNNLKNEDGMPYIVIVIDELSDLMMMAARDVESLIVRIAQKARASGIHLILATQRPSVDVITGLIKANVPARIAFTTTSHVDSKTIIDQVGAEKLLGQGDMLFLTSNMPKPKRVQAAFISDKDTTKVTDFIREQRPPQYDDEVISQPVQIGKGGVVAEIGSSDTDDDLWRDAVQVVIDGRKASTSLLQRRLRVGYARAARLIETMEEQGIVGPAVGSRPREVLISSISDIDRQSEPDDIYSEIPDNE
jgi:S-DNA-T family DNA segregation ATPase FtsK/SpoIIIE